jgi:hypothetical protein
LSFFRFYVHRNIPRFFFLVSTQYKWNHFFLFLLSIGFCRPYPYGLLPFYSALLLSSLEFSSFFLFYKGFGLKWTWSSLFVPSFIWIFSTALSVTLPIPYRRSA